MRHEGESASAAATAAGTTAVRRSGAPLVVAFTLGSAAWRAVAFGALTPVGTRGGEFAEVDFTVLCDFSEGFGGILHFLGRDRAVLVGVESFENRGRRRALLASNPPRNILVPRPMVRKYGSLSSGLSSPALQ